MFTALIEPPRGLDGPDTGNDIAVIVLLASIVGLLVWAIVRREWLLPILLAGAFAASLVEAQLDLLSRIWWAEDLTRSYTMFDRPIPLMASLGYTMLVGGGTYSAYRLIVSGATRQRLLIVAGTFFVVESAFEMVWLNIGFYEYYGPQPLEVAGFPLYWGAINAVGAITAGYVVYLIRHKLQGSLMLAAFAIPPLSFRLGLRRRLAGLGSDERRDLSWGHVGRVADHGRDLPRGAVAGVVGSRPPAAECAPTASE